MAASRNFLRGLSERVRRSLALTGVVSADFPMPIPVSGMVLVDDATRPGTGSENNRRIAHIGSQAGTAQQPSVGYVWDGIEPLIIESLYYQWAGSAAQHANVRIDVFQPSAVPTWTNATQIVWTDRPKSILDLAPMWLLQDNNLANPGTGVNVASFAAPPDAGGIIPCNIVLEQYWTFGIFIGAVGTGTLTLGFSARSF